MCTFREKPARSQCIGVCVWIFFPSIFLFIRVSMGYQHARHQTNGKRSLLSNVHALIFCRSFKNRSKTMADQIDVVIWFPPHHRSQKCYRNICILGSATSKITQSAIAERVHRNISRDAGTQQCHRVFFADSYHDISAYLRHHMFAFNINVCVKFQLELRKMERETVVYRMTSAYIEYTSRQSTGRNFCPCFVSAREYQLLHMSFIFSE